MTPHTLGGSGGGILLDPNNIPLTPNSRLNITTVPMSNQTGLYRLNLDEVVPDLSDDVLLPLNTTFSPVGFLLKVENHHTAETSYIWQVCGVHIVIQSWCDECVCVCVCVCVRVCVWVCS